MEGLGVKADGVVLLQEEDPHGHLIRLAWSSVFTSEDAVPPPVGNARLREDLRKRLISASVEELPSGEGLEAVNALLQWELGQRSLVEWQTLERVGVDPRLALWQGDITLLRIGGIVNAANEGGLGCFVPNHRCIDNVIHCAAGPALRAACAEEMCRSGLGSTLPTGHAIVTPGFNLPADYVIHTPGPVGEQPDKLAQCYKSVLDCCKTHGIRTVAFCCISTGLFGYPPKRAAEVAVRAVRSWLDNSVGQNGDSARMDLVVFNTFLDSDFRIYQSLLADAKTPQERPG